MKKYEYISRLSAEISGEVVKSENNWKHYLHTASRLYKYSFEDQLLIYAQRPNASACAEIGVWNEAMHCWVNKGAKGIALLDDNSPYGGLRYVFDISDVHKSRGVGRFPNLWRMQKKHKEAVLSRLESIYGKTDENGSFVERIREISERLAEESAGELTEKIKLRSKGSLLEEMDATLAEEWVQETLAESIAYMVLMRCGLDKEEAAESIRIPAIRLFNSMTTLSLLGNSVTELSKPILMEIGKCIEAYDREQTAQKGRYEPSKAANVEQSDSPEKKFNLGLANTSGKYYNALKRESENTEQKEQAQTVGNGEGSNAHGNQIRKERGLHDSDVKAGRTAGGNTDKIRNDEENLSQGEREGTLLSNASGEQSDGTSSGNSGAGRGTDGSADKTDDKQEGVTEQLKAENQMLWVAKMNNIRHAAEENVLAELIYS